MCIEKHVLLKRFLINKLNMPLRAWVKKTVQEVEKHWLSGKKKRFQAPQLVKEIMLIVFWDMKEGFTINFLEKDTVVNCASYCQLLW